jgi:hypothetical protein
LIIFKIFLFIFFTFSFKGETNESQVEINAMPITEQEAKIAKEEVEEDK